VIGINGLFADDNQPYQCSKCLELNKYQVWAMPMWNI